MKIVLDTNVFISGIFFSGPPSEILKAWKDSKIQIMLSKEILFEYQRVAEELSSKFPPVNIKEIIVLFMIHGEIFETKNISVNICEDPDDKKFIECAIASTTKIIVSGDKHLLKISGFKGISVLKPREFLDNYLKWCKSERMFQLTLPAVRSSLWATQLKLVLGKKYQWEIIWLKF